MVVVVVVVVVPDPFWKTREDKCIPLFRYNELNFFVVVDFLLFNLKF